MTKPAKKQGPQKKKRQHDPVYRRIFNRAQMIEEILRRFATGPWAAHLDYSTLAPVPADFMAKYLKKYEADIIWRVRYGPGKGDWFFVFVLMELQSSAPRFMALRLLGYVIQLCEALSGRPSRASGAAGEAMLPSNQPVPPPQTPREPPRRADTIPQTQDPCRYADPPHSHSQGVHHSRLSPPALVPGRGFVQHILSKLGLRPLRAGRA